MLAHHEAARTSKQAKTRLLVDSSQRRNCSWPRTKGQNSGRGIFDNPDGSARGRAERPDPKQRGVLSVISPRKMTANLETVRTAWKMNQRG
jgi:hypothetical protein